MLPTLPTYQFHPSTTIKQNVRSVSHVFRDESHTTRVLPRNLGVQPTLLAFCSSAPTTRDDQETNHVPDAMMSCSVPRHEDSTRGNGLAGKPESHIPCTRLSTEKQSVSVELRAISKPSSDPRLYAMSCPGRHLTLVYMLRHALVVI